MSRIVEIGVKIRAKGVDFYSQTASFIVVASVWIVLNVIIIIRTGKKGDYIYYVQRWKAEAKGENPYSVVMPYGILHSLTGKLARFGELAPKLFMFSVFCLGILSLYQIIKKVNPANLKWFYVLIPTNFYIIVTIAVYGNNDTLIAGLLAFVILLLINNRDYAAGIMFGILLAVKITPLILIIPIVTLTQHYRRKFLSSTLIMLLMSNFLTLLFYGPIRVGKSMLFSLHTSSSLLNPLESLKNLYSEHDSSYSAHGILMIIRNFTHFAIRLNPIIEILVFVLVFTFLYSNKVNWLNGSIIMFVITLSFFNMVHPQYFLCWHILLAASLISTSGYQLIKIYLPLILFFEFYQLGFFLTNGYSKNLQFFYHNGGLIFTPIMLFCSYQAFLFVSDHRLRFNDFDFRNILIKSKYRNISYLTLRNWDSL